MTGLAPQDAIAPDRRFAAPQVLMFGIGAQKSATSWIDRYLRGHPEVCLPVRKEQHYWTTRYLPEAVDRLPMIRQALRRKRPRGLSAWMPWRREGRRHRALRLTEAMLKDRSASHVAYADVLFQDWTGQPVVGEITPAYALLDAPVFAEMAAMARDVRFVFIMREPLDRLDSALRHDLRKSGGEAAVTPERVIAALAAVLQRVEAGEADPAFARSRYDLTISRLESVVPRHRVCHLFYETLFDQAELDRLTGFLGIAPHPAEPRRRVNQGVGGRTALPGDLEARARVALAPVFEFVKKRFDSQVPQAWWAAAGAGDRSMGKEWS